VLIRKLLSVNPARIGRFECASVTEAVPDSLAHGTQGKLTAELVALLGKDRVLHRAIDLVRYASDASPYRLTPQVVMLPRTVDEVVKIFRYCRERATCDLPGGRYQPERPVPIRPHSDRRSSPLVWREDG
jgi:D-lactate dehydrogenase